MISPNCNKGSVARTISLARHTGEPVKRPNPQMSANNEEGNPRERGADKVLSRADVAHWLGVSVGAVDGYCRAEDLPFRKVGRRVLFRRRDVEKWFGGRGGNGASGRGGARG